MAAPPGAITDGQPGNAIADSAPTATNGGAAATNGAAGSKKVMPFTERPLQGVYRVTQGGAFNQSTFELMNDTPDGAKRPQDEEAEMQAQAAMIAESMKAPPTPMIDRVSFNVTVAVLTFLNIIVLGLEQEMVPPNTTMGDRMNWYMLECVFAVCFAVELVIRIVTQKIVFFIDLWNVLDLALVSLAIFDAFFLVPVGSGGQIRYFLVIRALRVVRLVKLVPMIPLFREVVLLIGGLMNSVKALGWVGLIVMMVMYVCAIVVTTEIGLNHDTYGTGPSYDGEVWPYEEYFGTIWRSMFSLFQVVTLDSWCDDIVRHVVYRQPLMGIFFIVFLLLTAFGLMNVVVGIIVENTLAAAQVADRRIEEQAAFARKDAVERLADILERSDTNRTGEISLEELRASYQSDIVREKFDRIGLTFEEVQEIFKLLDADRRGRIEIKRFANSCRELVGGAKRRDIAQVEVTVGGLAQHLDNLDGQFAKIETEIRDLSKLADDFVQNTVRVLTGFDGSSRNGSAGGYGSEKPRSGSMPPALTR